MDTEGREYEIYLEKNVVVMLVGDRIFTGTFKSYDQYNSITLNYTNEWLFIEKEYGRKQLGLLVIRSDSIVFIGMGRTFSTKGLREVNYDELKENISNRDLVS